ncbi:hydrogenase-1 expression HyaE [Novosphingobium sp. FSY-8]|uniref:Hydrogenase-1 expression HyaE n=1 Tax=Novosphingobium ovatum TaxID=1908523 RepID=A0ABW9X9N4_9SPHN|nr:hydrogenase-1 expression HyaE [Novosphingobium ovatum]NBC35229.1 hydrogenase-1 expression HyaE [Novosphingobium ovatum]
MDIETAPDRTAHSPLLARVMADNAYQIVDEAALDAAEAPLVMLLLAGDWWRLAESDDVAAILPELDKAMGGHVAVMVGARAAERALQKRFRFNAFPALVFLRNGEWLGTLEGIRDWADYMREIPQILTREPGAPPPFRIPAGWQSAPANTAPQTGDAQ